MRVLVACEFSATVRDAFAALGHDAWSCDLLPSDRGGQHIQGDVLEVIGAGWDLMIAHPPCTYHVVSGARWFYEVPAAPRAGVKYGADRFAAREEARAFVLALWNAAVPRVAIENPLGTLGAVLGPYSQVVHPYQFGHDASKSTCLWLRGLSPLVVPPASEWVAPRLVEKGGKQYRRWANQSDGAGADVTSPSADRWRQRSVTYEGIALAMAAAWGRE